jgi:hypothetical protein
MSSTDSVAGPSYPGARKVSILMFIHGVANLPVTVSCQATEVVAASWQIFLSRDTLRSNHPV